MIVITGATGNLGKATINFLLKKGVPAANISALVRDEAKAADLKSQGVNLKIGDYDNYSSLVAAFKGAEKLLLISGSDIVNRIKQQENAVKAAKEAGVKHILYTSFERKDETDASPIALVAKAHIDTEKNVKESGIPYTIFRNNIYTDMLPMFLGEKVFDTGVFLPAGNGKVAFVTRLDMAEAIANVLTTSGHENKMYRFSNTEYVTFQDIADTLTSIAGKTVPYTSPSAEVYTETLTKAGVPGEYVGVFAGFAGAMRQGEFEATHSDLEKLLGRKPTTVTQYLRNVYSPN